MLSQLEREGVIKNNHHVYNAHNETSTHRHGNFSTLRNIFPLFIMHKRYFFNENLTKNNDMQLHVLSDWMCIFSKMA